jgi:dihydrolipoamide dehydrogenase
MSNHYQIAVIGSGSGGREAAFLAARKGLRTAVIERDKIGGVSFHRGCYAIRALQACASQYRNGLKSGRFGSKVELLKATLYDWIVAQSEVSSRLATGFEKELRELNIDLHRGHAEFVDERTLEVIGERGARRTITAENIIVASGSRPAFYGSSMRRVVNSEELLSLTTLPNRLAIIGAGYIGCEFASIYRTLECEVTLVEKEARILPGWEGEAGERVAEMLKERSVNIKVEYPVQFEQIAEQPDSVHIFGPNGQRVEADLVLVATGRKPNSMELGLEALGIKESSFLKVDDQMRVSGSGIYAVGDVNGISMLDSTAFAQANVAINAVLGRESRFDRRWIPRCVHTEPAIAAVGWTEDEAAVDGIEYFVVKDTIRLISDNDRSVIDPEQTFVKVIIDAHSMHLLGCLIVGDHAAVIANTAAMAMRSGLTIEKLRELAFAQPSAADALLSVLRKIG